MTIATTSLSSQAEELLCKHFARVKEPTKYAAFFRTVGGRHLALTRQRGNDIYIWAECSPEDMEGVVLKNRDHPGQPYSPAQPRASSIKKSPRLGIGNQAYYLKCETLGAVERFTCWYNEV